MTTTKTIKPMKQACQAERSFFKRIERLRNEGHVVTVETKPADACFGERVSASVHSHEAYICWTLQRKGGIITKKTTVKKYASLHGKKTDFATAYHYI